MDKTLERHLHHPQMRAWYGFDEGGVNATAGWQRVRAAWQFERGDAARLGPRRFLASYPRLFGLRSGCRLVLFAGLPDRWLEPPEEIIITGWQTYLGFLR